VLAQLSQPSAMNLNETAIIGLDEGVRIPGPRASRLNCIGAGVTCTQSGSTIALTIPGGGSGGGATTPDGGLVAANYASPFALWQVDSTLPSSRVITSGTNTTIDNGVAGQTKVNVSGTLPQSLGGMGVTSLTCSAGTFVTCNGTVCSCSTPSAGPGSIDGGVSLPYGAPVVTWQTDATLPSQRTLTAGTNVTLSTATPGQIIISSTGGGGGSANVVEASLALTDTGYFAVTVTGQTWVTASSKVLCQPFGTTADGLTPETIAVAGLDAVAANLVVSTGFDVLVFNPRGLVGTVRFHCTGA
jgi:hypothetical protein